MSDGPYRSLPMSRAWKRLAKFAENLNFSHEQMAGAAVEALETSFRKDVPAALVTGLFNVFLEPQADLFGSDRAQHIQALSDLAAGHVIGRLLIDHAVSVVLEGRTGQAGLVEAAQRTFLDYGARATRQIEEIYTREAPPELVRQVRDRVWRALSDADRHTLGMVLFGLRPLVARTQVRKQTGLEDGVPL